MSRLSIVRGDTKAFTLTLTDVDTGDPLLLTGLDLTFSVKYRLADTQEDALIVKTSGDGIVVAGDPALGIATLTLEPDDTNGLTNVRTLVWDVQVEDGLEVRTPLMGTFYLIGDVTTPAAPP